MSFKANLLAGTFLDFWWPYGPQRSRPRMHIEGTNFLSSVVRVEDGAGIYGLTLMTGMVPEAEGQPIAELPSRLFKYIDVAHADLFAAGSVKTSPFSTFATIENGRADARDGQLHVHAADIHMDQLSPAAKKRISPLIDPDSVMRLTDCEFVQYAANQFCFCTALHTDPELPEEGDKALFEIIDPIAFVNRITELALHLHTPTQAAVRYVPRLISVDAEDEVTLDPFAKDPAFEGERELRIVWTHDTPAEEFDPIFVGPDEAIARTLRRIR